MNSTLSESDEALALQELRIVLIGRSEAGKSSIGNVILGRDAFKETTTTESEKQRGRVEDRNISIIDTPGFFNTHLTDEEQQEQMMKSLCLSHPGPHVFLLVVRFDRFMEDVGKIVKTVRRYFGKDAFRFTMVLFTGREAMSKREWIEFRLSKKTRELLSFCEEKCHVIVHKNKRDKKQIAGLLENISEVVRKNGREHFKRCEEMNVRIDEDEMRDKQRDVEENEVSEKIRAEETQNSVQRESRRTDETENRSSGENQSETCLNGEKTSENNLTKMSNLRIVVLGKSGSGKSSTANTILGRDAFEIKTSSSSAPQTCEKQEAHVCGRNVSVIDTPGLWDPSVTRDQDTCVDTTDPGPRVFLLVLRLDESITEEKHTLKWIQENFGEEASRHTIILFTHTDHLKEKTLEEFIRDNNDLQTLVDECGGRFHSFNNKDMKNRSQVTELMEKMEEMMEEIEGENSEKIMSLEDETGDEERGGLSLWIRGALVFFIGALAAAAVAKTGLDK